MAPRIELLPLIDVIFLLLTFFIYSLIVMVKAQVLPVELLPIKHGQQAESGLVHAITIDGKGVLYFDNIQITMEQLPEKLKEVAMNESAQLYLAPAITTGKIDRLPIFLQIWQMAQDAGASTVYFVGPAEKTDRP